MTTQTKLALNPDEVKELLSIGLASKGWVDAGEMTALTSISWIGDQRDHTPLVVFKGMTVLVTQKR